MAIATTIDESKLSSALKDEYVITSNTFARAAKKDPEDYLEVEVGDAKQVDFYPQVKLKRWDNEVNFSARLIDAEPGEPVIGSEENKIVWTKEKRSIRFYELPSSELHPEGGYEFEITLKAKPETNVIGFTLQTKGLRFLFQGELSKEEKTCQARPDHVINSYAVYYNNCPANHTGGKLYRSGKAFHIYRPKIQDSKGDWVWGTLLIDEINNLMTVTIPQDFLDKAVYPVVHASGTTMGFTTAGGTQFWDSYGMDDICALSATVSARGGVATSLSTYGYCTGGGSYTCAVQGGLYNGTSLISPQTAIGSWGAQYASWANMNFTAGPTLTASASYNLSFFVDGGVYTGVWYYDTDASVVAQQKQYMNYSQYNTWESTIAWTGSLAAYKFSVYLTYTENIVIPTLDATTSVSSITNNTAISGGNITDDGGASVTARGVCWGTSSNPTTAGSKTTDGSGTGSFSSSLTGLSGSTSYHCRAYAVNSAGTGYGPEVDFTTLASTAISTKNGLAKASISTLVGLAKASMKSANGLA